MQVSPKIKNVSVPWTAFLKPYVTDIVDDGNGNYYMNVAGYNDVLTNVNVWFPVFQASTPQIPEIDLDASAISGADPAFVLDLSGQASIPAFPRSFAVYIDQTGSGAWLPMDSPNYDPVNKILSGMDNPALFPAELIKILVA